MRRKAKENIWLRDYCGRLPWPLRSFSDRARLLWGYNANNGNIHRDRHSTCNRRTAQG